MKKPGFKLLFGIFFGIELCLAQSYINLSVDNDLFFMKDRYYSSGIFISTGKLNKNQDKSTKYVHWTLGHEIYTPSIRYTKEVKYYDYPYGGWLFFERAEERNLNSTTARM